MRAPVRLRPGVSRRVAPQCQTRRPDPPRSTKRISPSMTQPAPRDPRPRQPSRLALARSWALDLGRPASRRYQRSGDKHHCRGGPARAFPARRRRVSSSNSAITTTTRMSTIKRKTIPAMRRSTANDPCSAHCRPLRVSSRVPHAAPRAPPCSRTRAARARMGRKTLIASRDCDPPDSPRGGSPRP